LELKEEVMSLDMARGAGAGGARRQAEELEL
jgi:hypothetical protein